MFLAEQLNVAVCLFGNFILKKCVKFKITTQVVTEAVSSLGCSWIYDVEDCSICEV
jgi:hypothetical protein